MSESLRNDGRIWVPEEARRRPLARPDPRGRARLLPRAQVPVVRQPRPPRRRVPQRQGRWSTRARASGPLHNGVYLDFGERRSTASARTPCASATGTSSTCTSASPTRTRTRCRCASTRRPTTRWAASGWTTTSRPPSPASTAIGEANFSDHGANRLGASALMQGLADGYFVLPYTIGDGLRPALGTKPVDTDHEAFQAAEARVQRALPRLPRRSSGTRSVDCVPPRARQDHVGLLRHGAHHAPGLEKAISGDPGPLRGVPQGPPGHSATTQSLNQSLEKAGRVDDFFELGLADVPRRPAARGVLRRPLPGRAPDRRGRGAARRRRTSPTSAPGSGPASCSQATLHKEPLVFENVHLDPAELQVTPWTDDD